MRLILLIFLLAGCKPIPSSQEKPIIYKSRMCYDYTKDSLLVQTNFIYLDDKVMVFNNHEEEIAYRGKTTKGYPYFELKDLYLRIIVYESEIVIYQLKHNNRSGQSEWFPQIMLAVLTELELKTINR